MIIESVTIKNILSFGPNATELEDFRSFNLFIGRNGSGKTNALRILGDLKTEFSIDNHNEQRWKAKLPHDFQNLHAKFSSISSIGDLSIQYRDSYDSNLKKLIEFQEGDHVSGDFTELRRLTTFIDSPISDFDLETRLYNLLDSQLNIINFGLQTIFGLEISIGQGALLINKFSQRSDVISRLHGNRGSAVEYKKGHWPSGFIQAVSILIQFLTNRHIVLIDEPERSLEPIRCRYLVRFLFWLMLRGESSNSIPPYVKNFMKDYDRKWKDWIEQKETEDDFTCCENIKQVFISSHAPHLIQEFLALGDSAAIYEFNLEQLQHRLVPYDLNFEASTLFTSVRRVETNVATILENIGANGSDLLQANGVIWVEGPSDVIYISKWIEMYALEKLIPVPRKGIDFQFQMYGGTLLDSICITPEDLPEEEQFKKIIDMFSFSRNAFIAIDSDALIRNGAVVDNSKFKRAKEFIEQQFVALKQKGYKLGLWYDKRNINVYSIENYLDDATIRKNGCRGGKGKVIYARNVVNSWDDDKKLSEFKGELESKIKNLVECVRSWNEH
jgi:hypothetical protein